MVPIEKIVQAREMLSGLSSSLSENTRASREPIELFVVTVLRGRRGFFRAIKLLAVRSFYRSEGGIAINCVVGVTYYVATLLGYSTRLDGSMVINGSHFDLQRDIGDALTKAYPASYEDPPRFIVREIEQCAY